MLTKSGSSSLYGQLTDNDETANLSFGDVMINEGIRAMLSKMPWPFLEKTTTATTVSGTQSYVLPGDMARLINVYITVGTIKYAPIEVTSADDWASVNNPVGIQSDTCSYYYILGNTIQFWPIPATTSNVITYDYVQQTRDLNAADYTTGSILTATNGSASIVGSGTTWAAGMVGSYIRITSGNAANLGDGLWYKIASVGSATTLTLTAVYTGVSIAAGSAAYTIGNVSLIPEKFQIGPVYYAVAEYWRKQNDESRADRFEAKYNDILTLMIEEEGTKGSSAVIDNGGRQTPINTNLARFM